jgi:SAM-dependent methyltransferase
MYSKERIEWWRNKSNSKEHQKAYDNIINSLDSSGKILLDVGCGTGELLKRAYIKNRGGIYVGTDSSLDMIKIAKDNLRYSGIPINTIFDTIGQSSLEGKVTLILDDLTNSKLSDSFSDVVFLTFPEIFSQTYLKGDITNSLGKILKSMGCSTEEAYRLEIQLRTFREVVNKIIIGGTLISARYDTSSINLELENRKLEGLKYFNSLIGLELVKTEFFESEEVWSDTEGTLEEGEIPGYRIFNLQRLV